MSDPAYLSPVTEAPVNEGLPCPECGQLCNGVTGLGTHRRAKHGVLGKSSAKRKPVTKGFLCGIDGCEFTSRTPQGVGRHRLHAHGIQGNQRKTSSKTAVATISGDEIVNVVLQQLFPNGIPVDKIRDVLEWALHTDHFMEQLRE